MSNALLVPVQLDALVIDDASPMFSIGKSGPLTGTPEALKKGVHLHWALPDGLCRTHTVTERDAQGEVVRTALQFESLPDQWLVVRLEAPSTAPWERTLMTALLDRRRRLHAWLGDARAGTWTALSELSAWQGVPTEAGGREPTWLTLAGVLPGGRIANPGGTETQAGFNPLGAGSPGLAAAYYPTSRFRFHDDLSGVTRGPLTYVVIGWYASVADCDPLYRSKYLTDEIVSPIPELARARWAEERGFRVSAGSAPAATTLVDPVTGTTSTFGGTSASFPDHLVLHGQVYEVAWGGKGGRYQGSGQGPRAPQVGVFQTGQAALATLVGADGHPAGRARAEAVGAGLLRELPPRADGGGALFSQAARTLGAGLVQELHRRGFRVLADDGDAEPGRAWARPVSPVLAVLGGGRSFRHGHDGRHQPDGGLRCRWHATGLVSALLIAQDPGVEVIGADLLEALDPSALSTGGTLALVPGELTAVLAEQALLDPSNAELAAWAWAKRALAGKTEAEMVAAAKAAVSAFRVQAELAAAQADPVAGTVAEELFLGLGVLPSPITQNPWCQPWTPLFADVSVSFFPSKGTPPALLPFWRPGPVEYGPLPTTLSMDASGAVSWTERVPLIPELVRRPMAELERGAERGRIAERLALADGLRSLDLLSGGLGAFYETILAKGWPVAAGAWKIGRLRLVDTYGTWFTLVGSNSNPDPSPATARCTERAIGTVVRSAADRGLLEQNPLRPHAICRPRLSDWGRIHARWLPGLDDPDLAGDGTALPCGFLLPDHVDHSLELFSALGFPLGQVRAKQGLPQWEPGPGEVSGESPVRNAAMAGLRAWLLRTSATLREPALTSFSRLVQLAGFTIQRGAAGTEARGLLFGRPLAVALLALRLELRRGAPALPWGIPVSLGSLAQPNDGLIAWGLPDANGALSALYSVHSSLLADETLAAAEQGVAQGQLFEGLSNGGSVTLSDKKWTKILLIFDPYSVVYLSSGLLPRLRLAPQQDAIYASLGRLCPAIRVGPVLVDPEKPRLAVPAVHGCTWVWQADGVDGRNPYALPVIDPVTPRATLPSGQRLQYGWMRLLPPRDPVAWGGLDPDAQARIQALSLLV